MTFDSAWPVPFVLAPQNLAVDAVVAFAVSVLVAVLINAEAQAFVSTMLGDTRSDPKDRFHFNAFLHLGLLGSICYLVGGFGWPRQLGIDSSRFRYPRLYMVLSRLAGPVANLLLAGIGGSLVMFMNIFGWNARVFLMVVGVNVTTAVYSLLPLPPLAGGWVVYELIPEEYRKVRSLFLQAGPFLIIALALLDRVSSHGIISPYLDPIVRSIFAYIQKF